mmetsp:Transcript_25825/g.56250  ORF Transcript_25825/g.56250 Transcript_25825/m.56250 type:complete len:344 (+) Transcript_25825:181-1212(+)
MSAAAAAAARAPSRAARICCSCRSVSCGSRSDPEVRTAGSSATTAAAAPAPCPPSCCCCCRAGICRVRSTWQCDTSNCCSWGDASTRSSRRGQALASSSRRWGLSTLARRMFLQPLMSRLCSSSWVASTASPVRVVQPLRLRWRRRGLCCRMAAKDAVARWRAPNRLRCCRRAHCHCSAATSAKLKHRFARSCVRCGQRMVRVPSALHPPRCSSLRLGATSSSLVSCLQLFRCSSVRGQVGGSWMMTSCRLLQPAHLSTRRLLEGGMHSAARVILMHLDTSRCERDALSRGADMSALTASALMEEQPASTTLLRPRGSRAPLTPSIWPEPGIRAAMLTEGALL